jgi:hypothetical protein
MRRQELKLAHSDIFDERPRNTVDECLMAGGFCRSRQIYSIDLASADRKIMRANKNTQYYLSSFGQYISER